MKLKKLVFTLLTLSLAVFANQNQTLGGMANTLRGNFSQIASLMISVAYVAGIGFGITSIFKFKQHKDNPQQVPIGTPFAMMAISVLLIFLPAIYVPAGASIFGANATSGSTTGDLGALPGDDETPAALGN